MDKKYDVFVSYSRHDTNVVNEFVDWLEREGFSVWIDRDGIESGDAFKRIILQAIKSSAAVLFFSSQHSNQSSWTAKEIGVAVKYQKTIIPILLDGSNFNEEVEFDLINLDFIDYQDASLRGMMMDRLVKSLKAKIPNPMGQKKVEEARLKAEAAERERLEEERRRIEEAERKVREETERKAREEAERQAREAAERERQTLQNTPVSSTLHNDTPALKKKKTLWIALGIGIAAVVALIVILAKPKPNGHDYVDLGLPSGTLWATCNIGASRPEDYGNYYAWGETSTKSTYQYCNDSEYTLTKYCTESDSGYNGFTDKLITLQAGDDPATAWGSGWRTPSEAQWDELLANTTNTWTTQNGVKGRKFTSKKNGQSLFLPAAGGRWDDELNYAGSDGYYWSSSLDTIPNYASYFRFHSDNCNVSSRYRDSGFTVRPVREN